MSLTPEQAMFHSGYQKHHTSAQSLDAMGNKTRRQLQDDVVDILTAAHKHGLVDMTASEVADQYQKLTGKFKPPSSFSAAIDALRAAKRIAVTDSRVYVGTGRMQVAYCLVAQQVRLVG